MQCDIVGYPVVARANRGKEIGITWVYQNGAYTHEGNRRKFLYKGLKKFWDAYDTTRIIKSQSISKRDINAQTENRIEEQIYEALYKHLQHSDNKKLSVIDVKKITHVDWNVKKLDVFLNYLGKRVKNNRGTFDFDQLF